METPEYKNESNKPQLLKDLEREFELINSNKEITPNDFVQLMFQD